MTDKDRAYWLSWCVEEYAAEKEESAADISKMFEENDIYVWLDKDADVLHTQGREFILNAIDEKLRQH